MIETGIEIGIGIETGKGRETETGICADVIMTDIEIKTETENEIVKGKEKETIRGKRIGSMKGEEIVVVEGPLEMTSHQREEEVDLGPKARRGDEDVTEGMVLVPLVKTHHATPPDIIEMGGRIRESQTGGEKSLEPNESQAMISCLTRPLERMKFPK